MGRSDWTNQKAAPDLKSENKLDELNDILERKLRNEKCLRIAAEESLMDLQEVNQSEAYAIVHRSDS